MSFDGSFIPQAIARVGAFGQVKLDSPKPLEDGAVIKGNTCLVVVKKGDVWKFYTTTVDNVGTLDGTNIISNSGVTNYCSNCPSGSVPEGTDTGTFQNSFSDKFASHVANMLKNADPKTSILLLGGPSKVSDGVDLKSVVDGKTVKFESTSWNQKAITHKATFNGTSLNLVPIDSSHDNKIQLALSFLLIATAAKTMPTAWAKMIKDCTAKEWDRTHPWYSISNVEGNTYSSRISFIKKHGGSIDLTLMKRLAIMSKRLTSDSEIKDVSQAAMDFFGVEGGDTDDDDSVKGGKAAGGKPAPSPPMKKKGRNPDAVGNDIPDSELYADIDGMSDKKKSALMDKTYTPKFTNGFRKFLEDEGFELDKEGLPFGKFRTWLNERDEDGTQKDRYLPYLWTMRAIRSSKNETVEE